MLVRVAHPGEADGPRRLFHYVGLRAKKQRLQGRELRQLVESELDGLADPSWMTAVLAELNGS